MCAWLLRPEAQRKPPGRLARWFERGFDVVHRGYEHTLDWALMETWRDAGIPLEGAADHGVSEALYLRDPDDNGVELYWDRPQEQWPRNADGTLAMFTHPLDLDSLLNAASPEPASPTT